MNKNLLMQLISIRIKGMLRTSRNLPGKGKSKGKSVLFGVLMLYLAVVFEAMFVLLWLSLSVFCTMGLTWLYFALCGVLSLFMTVLMTAFMTRNQMYNASDNDLLLSMPIPSGTILLSRMAVLLGTSLLTVLMVTIPAVGVYIYCFRSLSFGQVIGILASVIAVTLTAQSVSCILGYLLHLLLKRVKNKAFGSMIFMVLFLAVYFTAYSKIGEILSYLTANGEKTAAWIRTWAAPVYSLGLAASGELLHSLLILVGSALIFALVYFVLSRTFLRSVKGSGDASAQKKTVKEKHYRRLSPVDTVFRKELRRLLTCSVYLTNTGLGVLLILAVAVAAPFLRGKINEVLQMLPEAEGLIPLVVPAMICFLNGAACFTAPSVSLEGKNLWIMRSMPVSGRDVLLGKLKLHLVLTGTASSVAGLVMSAVLGCGAAEIVLAVFLSAEIALLSGMLGLIYNLLMPNFGWTSEVTPCKQGMPVLFSMLTCMVLPIMGGVGYYLLSGFLSPIEYMAVLALVFLLCAVLLQKLIAGWGGKLFESFQC